MKLSVVTLSTEFLDQVWRQWLANERVRIGKLSEAEEYGLKVNNSYGRDNFNKRSVKAQRFEQWLLDQGARVKRKNGFCHLEFTKAEDATIFALKWV